uniref:caspase-2-like isoform X3 n=1 Tax=Myodes glareolus TaxID=447135 RepID=UPI0020201EB3|nr:caspase-2-like isoform X3 [Myodes glareolus]
MAFLVSGTLQAAAQLADAWDSLGRQGKYRVQGSRVALILSSSGVSVAAAAALDGVFQALGFENCEKRKVSVQRFHEELSLFREQLDIQRGAVGCALVVLMAPSGQLRQPQLLVQELSRCGALQGCPKIFLLLSSGLKAAWEPEAFLTSLGEICNQRPHWSLLQLLTEAFREELAQFREKLDTYKSPVSCALLALMAHGGPQGQLLGVDGQEVQSEMLGQELNCCQALHGRPKVFLLQACRGGNRDPGVGPRALPWYRRWLRAPPGIPTQADVLQVHVDAPGSTGQADILTVYSAAEGCVAYRDEEKGSDFVQTLVEVMRANPGGDLIELLTEVNRRVCELDLLGPDSDERRKACLEIRSSLRRRLCL